MKKIAIVLDSLKGGGAEKVMLTLAQTLIEMGHRVTLLSLSSDCDYKVPPGIDLHFLFSGKASRVDKFWQLKKSVAKIENWFANYQTESGDFDLVLSNLDRSNNLLANSRINKVFHVIHNSIEEELSRQKKLGFFAYSYLLKSKKRLNDRRLITVSVGIEKEIRAAGRIKPASLTTIYNPFNHNEIRKLADEVDPAIPEAPYVIHVGRVARQKRHDVLFECLQQIDPRYKLVLLCSNKNKALKLARKYGVQDRLILPDFQQNPYNWIKQAKALVLSSDFEGLPCVLIEALSVGTLTVSTLCPHGPDEIMTGELAQFLVARRDPKALARALNQALASDLDPLTAEILQKTEAHQVARQYLALC